MRYRFQLLTHRSFVWKASSFGGQASVGWCRFVLCQLAKRALYFPEFLSLKVLGEYGPRSCLAPCAWDFHICSYVGAGGMALLLLCSSVLSLVTCCWLTLWLLARCLGSHAPPPNAPSTPSSRLWVQGQMDVVMWWRLWGRGFQLLFIVFYNRRKIRYRRLRTYRKLIKNHL